MVPGELLAKGLGYGCLWCRVNEFKASTEEMTHPQMASGIKVDQAGFPGPYKTPSKPSLSHFCDSLFSSPFSDASQNLLLELFPILCLSLWQEAGKGKLALGTDEPFAQQGLATRPVPSPFREKRK